MAFNKPTYAEAIQWSSDYNEVTWDAINYVETYTYKSGGVYSSSGVYTGGVTVGYLYVKYDGATKANYVNSYSKKV